MAQNDSNNKWEQIAMGRNNGNKWQQWQWMTTANNNEWQQQQLQWMTTSAGNNNNGNDMKHTGLCALGLFSSAKLSIPIKYRHPQDQKPEVKPYHDRPPNVIPHNTTMTSFTKCNGIFTNDGPYLQKCWATSPSRTKSSFKSSWRGHQWDLC